MQRDGPVGAKQSRARGGRCALAWALCGMLLGLLPARQASAEADGPSGTFVVTLRGGLLCKGRPRRGRPAATPKRTVELELTCRNGLWDKDVWAFLPSIPSQEHCGQLAGASVEEGKIRLEVRLRIKDNPRGPAFMGGRAEYVVELDRAAATNPARRASGVPGTFRGRCVAVDGPEVRRALSQRWARQLPGGKWVPVDVDRVLQEQVADGEVSGAAECEVRPAVPAPAGRGSKPDVTGLETSFTPPRRGEHPRLFFRKKDLPALRAKAQTPEGRRMIEHLRAQVRQARENGFGFMAPACPSLHHTVWAAGYGLLYHLAGDAEAVTWSRRWCASALFTSAYYGGWHLKADQLMGVAICYDLFYDAWDADFRDLVMLYLERHARQIAELVRGRNVLELGTQVQFSAELACGVPRSWDDPNFARWRAAAGMAALAILGDPVTLFTDRPPPSPDAVETVEPARDLKPAFGAPVQDFADDAMLPEWLILGPFYNLDGLGKDDDPLASIGGRADARPVPGTTVTYHGIELDFHRLVLEDHVGFAPRGRSQFDLPFGQARQYQIYPRNENGYWSYSGMYGGYEPAKRLQSKLAREQAAQRPSGRRGYGGAAYRAGGTTVYLYTVLRNDDARIVQARPNWGYTSYGASMWINGRRCKDGDLVRLVPGLYPILVELPITGGYATQAPRLAEYTRRDFRDDLASYRKASAAYRAYGGTMPHVDDHARVAARTVRRFLAARVGDAGWYEGGWGLGRSGNQGVSYADFLELALPFVHAVRNVTGENLAADTGVENLVALGTFVRGWAFRNGRLGDLAVPLALGFAPARLRPVAKHYLQQRPDFYLAEPWWALMLMPYYPFDAAPAPPESVLGLSLTDERHGTYLLRRAWTGEAGGVLACLHLGRFPPGTGSVWPGTFNLRGPGWVWTQAPDNVLTIEGAVPAAGARLTHASIQPGHSAVFGMLTDRFHRSEGGRPTPMMAWRHVAFDFTGASGAQVLVAVVDKVMGADDRGLTWQMGLGFPGNRRSMELSGDGFRLAPSNHQQVPAGFRGTLAGTIIAPRKVYVWADVDTGESRVSLARLRGNTPIRDLYVRAGTKDPQAYFTALNAQRNGQLDPQRRVMRSGSDTKQTGWTVEKAFHDDEETDERRARGEFFVVLTIQDGEPPKVRVEGAGLNARVTVGRQVITFDGEKIVLAK